MQKNGLGCYLFRLRTSPMSEFLHVYFFRNICIELRTKHVLKCFICKLLVVANGTGFVIWPLMVFCNLHRTFRIT